MVGRLLWVMAGLVCVVARVCTSLGLPVALGTGVRMETKMAT